MFGRAKAASDKKVPVVPVVVPLYRDPALEIRAMVLPPKILGQRRVSELDPISYEENGWINICRKLA